MPRDIPEGNGSLLVTFDEDYFLRDIYFPQVGKENLPKCLLQTCMNCRDSCPTHSVQIRSMDDVQ